MSEIAALRATDRARPLPPALRRRAYAMIMDLPEEVAEVAAAEEPRPLPARVTREAFAGLMGPAAVSEKPRRMRRPMFMRLLAASLAVALPAAALIVSASLRDTTTKAPDKAPLAQGPVYEDRLDRGPRVLGLKIERPPALQKPTVTKAPAEQTPRPVARRTSTTPSKPRPGRTGRPQRQPVVDTPAVGQTDLVGAVLAQVTPVTNVVCNVTSAVGVQLCAGK